MELEEPEDEEWKWNTTGSTTKYYYVSEPDGNSGGTVSWVFDKGLNLGKTMLVAGFVASSAPLVVPPLVVASAIGIAVSVPYCFLLVSHACAENLMSKLLPRPTTPQDHPMLLDEEVCFQQDINGMHMDKEEQTLIGMVGVQHMNDEKDVTSNSDYGQGVVKEEYEQGASHSPDDNDVIQHNGSKKDESDFCCDEEEENAAPRMHDDVKVGDEIEDRMEGQLSEESKGEQPVSGGHEVVITIEGLDENGDDVEEFKAPFEVTTVVVEELGDKAIEGDIEEEKLQRETRGLLEAEDKDDIYNEVESAEPIRGVLEEKEVENTNDSQKQMSEHSELLDVGHLQHETIPAEPVGDLVIEKQDYNIPVAEDSSEVSSEKIDTDILDKEEPNPVLVGPTVLQEGKLDNNISDSVNQEPQLHEYNETMDSLDADAIKVADESGFDLSDEKRVEPDTDAYTIDLHDESSNVMVDGPTAPTEVPVSPVEQELRPSECSSGKDIVCPSPEVVFNEESVWKQIDVIRKITGYEGTKQASCADELKALYIFTGVEPPTFLKESDPAEINEKLHFLMSIVGIKSNAD